MHTGLSLGQAEGRGQVTAGFPIASLVHVPAQSSEYSSPVHSSHHGVLDLGQLLLRRRHKLGIQRLPRPRASLVGWQCRG